MASTIFAGTDAIGFNWALDVHVGANCDVVHMLSGEIFTAPKHSQIRANRWIAYRYHKTSGVSIDGIADILPYTIDWYVDLDDRQSQGLSQHLVQLNQRSQDIALWRRQLSDAEHSALISGTFAAVSGFTAVASGVAFIGDLFAGGIPWASGLVCLGSSVACGANLGALEAHARRGDACVRAINSTIFEVYDLGRQLSIPDTSPHQTPIIQSACTNVAQAFGWKDQQIKATQQGLASWLNADLRFAPA